MAGQNLWSWSLDMSSPSPQVGQKASLYGESEEINLVCALKELTFNLCVLSHVQFCVTPWTVAGEGNGTPFQYSCLENPMGGGAW